MAEVQVNLLGGFGAAVDGVAVEPSVWRLRKARELVKLLALAPGHRLHREQLMETLWADRAPAAAANNLHQAVHVARRALDPRAIEVHDGVIELRAAVDVERLERAATDARRTGTPAAIRAALALYTGELLPENRYDDWTADRRDELAELAGELAHDVAALRPAEVRPTSHLPADASSFVGRGRELAELRTLLDRTRMLTLAGTGGVGKTRLALELARGAEASAPGEVVLAELAAVADGRLVPAAVAAALDVKALPDRGVLDAVVEFLAPRTLVLVLDNCEHLLPAIVALVDALLRGAPRLTVVATSREPLRVPGEVVFRVPSLACPDPSAPLQPRQLLGFEAVRLFVERAAAAAPGFAVDVANAPDVARICFRLDGLPLAIELAASRVGALGPAAIADRLGDRFQVLRAASHASPTRQQTLAATLQWSHDLLKPDERILYRRLGTFVGGFELEAAEHVCPDGDLADTDVAGALARLVEKSLVIADDDGSARERRYRLLETVRMDARERLGAAGETAASADRHARWALGLAERERSSARLDRDAANVRAALDTLLEQAPAEALRFCVALLPFWLRRIDLREAQRRFDEALAAAPERTPLRAEALLASAAIEFRSGALNGGLVRAERSRAVASETGDVRAEWRALQFLGELAVAGDAGHVAMPWLERALALARREHLDAGEPIGVYSLGVAHWVLDDLERAEALVAESIDGFRALDGSGARIPSPVNISELRVSRPRGRPAMGVVFEDTLQPFAEISAAAAVGWVLANQAAIARRRGDPPRARALLDESSTRFAALADDEGSAAVLVRRAYIDLEEGALPAARRALESALELRRRRGDRRGVGLVLTGLGLIATTAGDHHGAERHLAEARDIFRRAGDRWGLAGTLWREADLAFARGRPDEAEAALQEARVVLGATGRERWIAGTLAGLAEVAVLRGDLERASQLLGEARERYAARDDALGVADVDQRLRDLR